MQRYGHLRKAEFVTQLRNWAQVPPSGSAGVSGAVRLGRQGPDPVAHLLQDPHLAVEYSSATYRAERQLLKPPVLLPPVAAAPPRQVPQPFASPVRQRLQEMPPCRAQELLAKRAHPVEALPPLSPVPRPALKKPRSQIRTRPRSNIRPVDKEGIAMQRHAFADDDSDLEDDCEGKPVPCPSMVRFHSPFTFKCETFDPACSQQDERSLQTTPVQTGDLFSTGAFCEH